MGRRTVELEGVSCGLEAGRRGAVDLATGGRAAREGEKLRVARMKRNKTQIR